MSMDSLSATQVTVGTTATKVCGARATPRKVTFVNLGTTDVFLGGSAVTTSNGVLLVGTKGASLTLETSADIYAIVTAATQAISVAEVF